MAKKKTKDVEDIFNRVSNIADILDAQFDNNKDVKTASESIKAYKAALDCKKTQIAYKKLTGEPERILGLD